MGAAEDTMESEAADETGEIRVVVADDFPAVRRGVTSILSEIPECRIVGEAASAEEVLEVLCAVPADALMLDLAMPGVRGLDLVRSVRNLHPGLGILVFTMQPEDEFAIASLRAGANGFLNKSAKPEEVRTALRAVAQGRRYVSAAIMETLVQGVMLPSEAPPHYSLSERELQVLYRLAQGHSPSEIGERFGISSKTVHTYRTRIFQKLGLKTNVDLVLYAVAHRLLGWPPHEARVRYSSRPPPSKDR